MPEEWCLAMGHSVLVPGFAYEREVDPSSTPGWQRLGG
jgi:hypothetical protein